MTGKGCLNASAQKTAALTSYIFSKLCMMVNEKTAGACSFFNRHRTPAHVRNTSWCIASTTVRFQQIQRKVQFSSKGEPPRVSVVVYKIVASKPKCPPGLLVTSFRLLPQPFYLHLHFHLTGTQVLRVVMPALHRNRMKTLVRKRAWILPK